MHTQSKDNQMNKNVFVGGWGMGEGQEIFTNNVRCLGAQVRY